MWDIKRAVACVAGVRKETENRENNLFSSLSNSCQEGYEYRMPFSPGMKTLLCFARSTYEVVVLLRKATRFLILF